MRMAHIIMAYKDPSQVERLVKKLSHPGFDFYIHVDAKIDIAPFKYLAGIERVYLTQTRGKIRWAGFGFVRSLLNCAHEILTKDQGYDYINLLSGQDYPLTSTSFFYDFFEKHKGKSFLTIEKFGSTWWQEAISRIERYHFTDFDFKGRHRLESLMNRVLPKRKFPIDYTLYGSSRATWWTISADAARYVIKFLDDHPRVGRFARFTWAPDEFLIPTIIMNSPLKDTVVNNSCRYIDWTGGGANPKILTSADFDQMRASDKLLARKFDIKVDTVILDMLDKVTSD